MPTYPDLPVVAHREVLLEAIRDHQVVVVAGETGSGKSTQLPKLCLELGLGVRGLIGHTQPRRLAARAVSERIAEELGSEVGDAVGFTVRFNDRVGEDTFIKVMTDGILLAEIQRDRHLRAYEVLIIDEAHERSLNIDFLLGYLRQLLPERPDLKVIVTSATIDTARFAAHFGDAPVVEVSGRSYPVEVRYRPFGEDEGDDRDQTQAIVDAVQELMREGPGDLLVFLSGERDIRDTADALARLDLPGVELLPLYARLSAAEQHRVFAPHPGRRIVLATNVAETSLTVPGIVGVIDPGTARISRYNRRTKVQRLPDRADLAGVRRPASRPVRARGARHLHPPVLGGGLRRAPGVHRAGDPAHQPGVGHPPDGRARPGRHRRVPVRRGRPTPAASRTASCCSRSSARSSADEPPPTTSGSPSSVAASPASPPIRGWPAWSSRPTATAWWGRCSSSPPALSIQDPRERPTGEEEAAAAHHRRFADPDSDFVAYLNLWRYLRDQQKALGSSAFRRLCRSEHLHHLRIREWQDVHSQLRQVALGIGLKVTPLAEKPDVAGDPPGAAVGPPVAGRDARSRRQRVPRRPRGPVRAGAGHRARASAPEVGDGRRAGGDQPPAGAHRRPDRAGRHREGGRPPGHAQLRGSVVGRGARRGHDHRAGEPLRAPRRHRPPQAGRPGRPGPGAGDVPAPRAGRRRLGRRAPRVRAGQPGAGRRRRRPRGAHAARPARRRRRAGGVLRRPGTRRRHLRPPVRHLVGEGASATEPDRLTYRAVGPHRPGRRRARPRRLPRGVAARRGPAARSPTCSIPRRTSTAWWSTCRSRSSMPWSGPGSSGRCPGRRLDLVTALVRTLPEGPASAPHPRRRGRRRGAGADRSRRTARCSTCSPAP